MIYLDTSVLLAELFSETRRPNSDLWRESLVSSRLLEYESWSRVHRYDRGDSHGQALDTILGRVALIELDREVLARALDPFPTPVRTLDGLHLASLESLRQRGMAVELATFDRRLAEAARALDVDVLAVG